MWIGNQAVIVVILALYQSQHAFGYKLVIQHKSGSRGAPNWSGDLRCPPDYSVSVKSLKINRPCQASRCPWTNFANSKLNELRNNCKNVGTCTIQLRDSSFSDGDIQVEYECDASRLRNFFRQILVKRVYHDDIFPVYCNQRPRRDTNRNVINRSSSGWTFDEIVSARQFFAQHNLFGYFSEAGNLGPVLKTVVRRNRRTPSGDMIAVPVYISADLKHTRPSNTRKSFDRYINEYLNKCGKRKGEDDGGHLVAYTLCGDDVEINLVPMASDLNRPQGIWYKHEKRARQYLTDHPNGLIRWEVVVYYPPNASGSLRPVAFALRYTQFTDAQRRVNGAVRLETFINENEDYRNDQCTLDVEDFFKNDNDDYANDIH